MARYGLVRLERGARGRITPRVTHDRMELDLPPTVPRGELSYPHPFGVHCCSEVAEGVSAQLSL